MKYSEIIEKYVNGELEPEKAEQVENEIEKHEAIADYIAERDEKELSELSLGSEAEPEGEAQDLTKRIKRQMRRAFIKAGLITGAAVLGAVLFIIFALPKLVSKAYYDPSEKVGTDAYENDVTRLAIDVSVYTELFAPEYVRQRATAEAEGYGKYSIYIPQEVSYNGVFRSVTGKIKKNKLTLYDPNVLRMPSANCFETHRAGVTGANAYESGWDFDAEEYLEYFREGQMHAVFVTLEKPMSYDEFSTWCDENDVSPYWCAVCSNGYSPVPYNFGFLSNAAVTRSGLTGKLAEKYKYLTQGQIIPEKVGETLRYDEQTVKAHIIDMIGYFAENPDGFTTLLGEDGNTEYLKSAMREAAESIEANGFEIYGFMVFADKVEAERLCGMDGVIWLFNGSVQ